MTTTATSLDDRATWLAWRRTVIGASDIAKAHTGAYGGRYAVVADKLGRAGADTIDPVLADRGHRWEQPIADAVHALTGLYVHAEQLCVVAADNARHACTLDGLLAATPQITGIDGAEATLQIKTVGATARPNLDYAVTQCHWEMRVTGRAWAMLAVATIDDTDDTCVGVRLYRIERDDFTIGTLIEVADDLAHWIDAGELPPPDEHTEPDTVRAVNRVGVPWIDDKGRPVPSPDRDLSDLDDDMARYLEVSAHLKAVEAEKKALENRFRHAMGDDVEADGTHYRLRVGEAIRKFTGESEAAALAAHPEYARTVLDRDRFKTERPDTYEALKTESTDRRVTVKEIP